jgi:hypothetical protein
MPAKSGQAGNAPEWLKSYADVLVTFADLGPCLIKHPENYAAMSLAASRLNRLAKLLLTTSLKGELSKETIKLITDGIMRQREIVDAIEARTLAGGAAGFNHFDDTDFFDRVRALPQEEVNALLRCAIADPTTLAPMDRINQAALLGGFGIDLAAIDPATVIGFKIIAILILVLVVIADPALIPFALTALAVMKAYDESGESDENEGAGAGDKPPTAAGGGTSAPIPLPNGGTVSPGDGNTVVVLPDGSVVIVTPGGHTVVVRPDGSTTSTAPTPPPSTPPHSPGFAYDSPLGGAAAPPNCGSTFRMKGFGWEPTASHAEAAALRQANTGARRIYPSRCPAVFTSHIVTHQEQLPDGTYYCEITAFYECR